MQEQAITVDEKANSFTVPPNQEYDMRSYNVPGDFSSASYMMAAGALCGDVTIKNLYPSEQGDSALIEILEKMGAQISWDQEKREL